MSPTQQIFAYQPIVDMAQNPVAAELIYRGGGDASNSAQEAANVVLNAFMHVGAEELPHRRLTHLAAPAELLSSELLGQLPADRLALVIRPHDATAVVERLKELKEAGYHLVLDGAAEGDEPLYRLLPFIDVVRLDASAALQSGVPSLPELRASGVRLLARNVDRADMLSELGDMGFTLFQGYYFATPTQLKVPRADPRKLAVLDLLAKLSSDADDPVIEEAFKSNPMLSLQLLRIVNSSAFALTTRIRSIKHAFAILGRKQLERWLQVLLFACDGDSAPSPLMELALRRARFMEFVLIYRTHHDSTLLQDEAYMTGLLSLVDVLLGWSMQETVDRLNVTDEVREALLHREGPLGRLIDLCETLEAANFDSALPIAEALHLPIEAVMNAQNVALGYSENIGREQPEG